MGYSSNAGTPAPRYPLVKGTANPQGLYPWSVLEGRVCYITDEGIIAAADYIANGDGGHLLIFSCDVPVLFKGITGKGTGSTSPYYFDIANAVSRVYLLLTAQDPLADVVSIANYGQVGIGYTATGLVPCSGFGGDIDSVLVNGGGTSVAASLDIQVTALSGNIVSPIGSTTHDASGASAMSQIFLLESDYTQEIQDAGNLIVDARGDQYIVVGLHNFAPPAP